MADISAGLAYSVIKNALFKVIKLSCASYTGQATTMLSIPELLGLSYTSETRRCGGCGNNCMLTVNTFSGGRSHITGNRCEKGLGKDGQSIPAPNLFAYKKKRLFQYPPLQESDAPRGSIGIPRVLNLYENYPFWAVFFKELGFRVVLSPYSSRKIYELGMDSIPSESECYPAKLAHGHVQWLVNKGLKTIFHPCVFYEHQETPSAQNHYNCPMVVSYAENLRNNVESVTNGSVRYLRPFIAFTDEKTAANRLVRLCREEWNIPEKEVRSVVHVAWEEARKAKQDIRDEGARVLAQMEFEGKCGIVLAGRPYHLDPEINHGIPEMIASYGLTVFTEDSLPIDRSRQLHLRVVDQWVYHSRLYAAADFVSQRNDLELIQLNSFGCGLDAVTSDQIGEILENSNKLYTLLKIDEVNNLGAVRIRIRSLLAAMEMRNRQGILAQSKQLSYGRSEFTEKMRQEGYTILVPQMSPIHFDILEPVFHKHGYHVVILDNDNRSAIDTGLKYVNNDACYPSITVVGQIMEAVLSGRYDTDKLAIFMTQTGGCCRASNYVGFIRRALDKANLSHIPVISINANGMEKNPGFKWTPGLLLDAVHALIYGDLFMRCLYRVRPYEKTPGSANALHEKWKAICIDSLTNPKSKYSYGKVCQGIGGAMSCLGTTWTASAMVSQTAGVPVKVLLAANAYGARDTFMPGLVSIGELLQDAGYQNVLLVGSDAEFHGREPYFRQHGNFAILDTKTLKEAGRLPEDYNEWWGFEDEKLFAYAREELARLAAQGKPFNLTMLTADTHFPDGYICRLCENKHSTQYANVLSCSSRQVSAFVSWIKQQPFYENTTIILSGDHLTMDADFLDGLEDDYVRTTYNCIINAPITAANTVNRQFATFDLFPTTLAALGVEIPGDRLGLGTNLFSERETLIEEYGFAFLDHELQKRSLFYNEKILGMG